MIQEEYRSNENIKLQKIMQQQQSQTESDIVKHDSEDEEDQADFESKNESEQPVSIYFCICAIVVILLMIALKIATVITQQRPIVSIPAYSEVFEAEVIDQQEWKEVLTDPEIILENLESCYKEVQIHQASQKQVIKAEQLNQYHVQFKKALRSIDYNNALLLFEGTEKDLIGDDSSITYGQFAQALGLLQLTTFPILDFTKDSIDLPASEYENYKDKWNLWSQEEDICAIMLLSAGGLNSGNYYYALRSVFQQRYTKFRVVVVDNTPQLGLQAEILGLLKELSRGRDTVVLDRIKGHGNQASSIYYAIHRYCKDAELTIILKDNGQLIGQYAFSLFNEIHEQKQVPIVISNYLLDSGNLFTNLQSGFRYTVPLYPGYKDPSAPRSEAYKTKYLKSYKTQILMDLPLSAFQSKDGFWHDRHIESFLQFSALEKACGKYFFLQQILYRVPKYEIQDNKTVFEARNSNKAVCFSSRKDEINPFSVSSSLKFNRQYNQFQINLLQIDYQVDDEMIPLEKQLILFDRHRISGLRRTIQIEEKNIQKSVYGPELSVISKEKVMSALEQLMMGSRAAMFWKQEMNITDDTDLLIDYLPKRFQRNIIKAREKPQEEALEPTLLRSKDQTYFCILLELENNLQNFGYFYSIESVVKQQYSEFRLVILDNNSKDKTAQAVKRYLQFMEGHIRPKIHIYGGNTPRQRGETVYFASKKFCQAGEVIILMEGGEQLVGTDVLQKLNAQYRKENWLAVYSNSIYYHNEAFSIGISHNYYDSVHKAHNYRKLPLLMGQLRSFKAEVLLQVEEDDFKREGKWVSADLQFSLSYALLQLACSRVSYLDEILFRVKQMQKSWPTTHQPFGTFNTENTSALQQKNTNNLDQYNLSKPRYECLSQNSLTFSP